MKKNAALGCLIVLGIGVFLFLRTRSAPREQTTNEPPVAANVAAAVVNVPPPATGVGTAGAPAATVPPSSPNAGASGTSMDHGQFLELTEKVTRELPTIESLRNLTAEEAHHTPESVRNGGYELGRVKRALEENPDLIHDGLEFYRNCALSETIATPLRALCFTNLREFSQKVGASFDPNSPEFPENIRRLSDQIME